MVCQDHPDLLVINIVEGRNVPSPRLFLIYIFIIIIIVDSQTP